ncbi:neprilysin-like [Paramacrobiotus metropolitanus]|uniref:neprilysin-like n=1 Tax=Paramacrobiotus metropolitanus TaxID=2943436 RepID=UPI0024463714|nr:neprilysin-like [Paramacrobiotus metropolitanus]
MDRKHCSLNGTIYELEYGTQLFESSNYTNPTEEKAINIYNQCIHQEHGKNQESKDRIILGTVDDLLDGWSPMNPHRNVSVFPLDETLIRLQQNDVDTVGDLHVDENTLSSDENILYFRVPFRLLERAAQWGTSALDNTQLSELENPVGSWRTIVQRLLRAANTSVPWSTVENRMKKVIQLDTVLAEGYTGDYDTGKRITFGDLSRAPYRSRFLTNFLSLFNALLRASSVKFQATATTKFGAITTSYLLNLDKTMTQLESNGDAGRATLADWLWWNAVDHYLNRRTNNCVWLVKGAMPLTVSGMFFKTYIPDQALQKAKALTSDISNGVRDAVLLKAAWMDQATQEAAVDKLNHTLRMVGYPEEFVRNSTLLDELYAKIQVKPSFSDTLSTIDQSKSWINLQKLSLINARDNPFDPTDLTSANAAMEADRNYIVIRAALLQPPFFYADGMDIISYARLGFVIGHEFTHGFDIGGKDYGKDGKPFTWWTNTTQTNYSARKYSLVDFYNNISTPNNSVNGRLTLNENIADNGGYRAAYLAFHNFMRRTGYRIKLPGLEDLNEDKLFWLIAAQTSCTRSPFSGDSSHAPLRFRVMGPFMNNADFGKAYNCSLGSPMNPRVKAW